MPRLNSLRIRRTVTAFILSWTAVTSVHAAPPSPGNQQTLLAEAQELNDRFMAERNAGRYRAAFEAVSRAFALRKQALGERHADTLIAMNNLGMAYWDLGDRANAAVYLREAVRLRREVLGEKHSSTALSLDNLAGVLDDMGEPAAARPLYEQAVEIRRAIAPDDLDTAGSLGRLAWVLDELDYDLEARACYEEALEIRRTALGDKHVSTLTTLNNLGMLLKKMGDHAAARASLEQSLALRKEVFGERHAETAFAMHNLAALLDDIGEWNAAETLCKQAVSIYQEVLGQRHLDTALSMSNLARLLKELGRVSEARRYYEQVLAIRQELLGEDHSSTVLIRNALASLQETSQPDGEEEVDARKQALLAEAERLNGRYLAHNRAGRYRDAFDSAKRALAIRKELLPEDDPDVLISLTHLGMAHSELGEYAAADPVLQEALRLHQRRFGERHLETAWVLVSLATALSGQGNDSEARRRLEEALAIRKELLGEEHGDYLNALNNLGLVFQSMGDYASARQRLERSVELRKKVYGERHLAYALGLNNLATVLDDMGDYAAARPLYEQALAIRKELLGLQHPDVAVSMSNLASILQKTGVYREARAYFEQAVAIQRKALGDEHPSLATTYNNLGLLSANTGDSKGAVDYYKKALTIRNKVLGESHPATLVTLHNLGSELATLGDASTGREQLQRALELRKQALGDGHPDVANSLNNLAGELAALGDDAAAQARYEEALAIRIKALGEDHCDTAVSFSNLAWFFQSADQGEQAVAMEDRSRRAVRKHMVRVLRGLSEAEQLQFLSTDRGPFHMSLSIGLAQRRRRIARERSAAWAINGKALAQEVLTERTRLVRDARDPAVGDLIQQLLATRRQMASEALTASAADDRDVRRRKLEALTAREQELAREIARQSSPPVETRVWVELDDVRRQLAAGAVLVEIARFKTLDFTVRGNTNRWGAARYAAWIVPPANQGEVELIDLGEAATIDAAIERARSLLSQTPERCREAGEQVAERELLAAMTRLAELVWRPLAPHVNQAKKIVVSPDSNLWLVPWAALPAGKDRYLVEDFELQFVVSGRDLATTPEGAGATQSSLIVADPDFDLQPDEAQKELRKIAPKQFELVPDGERSVLLSTSLPQVKRLPGTAVEASLIAPNLQRYVRLAPLVRTDREALEGVVKAAQSPEVVVLSTHGYFLPDQETDAEKNQQLENPLLRCGLLFAGCNQPHSAGQDDGVLTGLEIVGLDLRGTRLVVLSACETGVGEVCNGEGVAGLRQAFQLAGAQSVVATLWQVPDRQSVKLMNAFFENLAAGCRPADALRRAQTALIAARRNRVEAAHPFFWAAFTVTGP